MNCQADHSFLRPHGVRVTVTERVAVLDWRSHTYVPFQRHYKTHAARAMALRDKDWSVAFARGPSRIEAILPQSGAV